MKFKAATLGYLGSSLKLVNLVTMDKVHLALMYTLYHDIWIHIYLAPGGGCEVLFSPCLSVCLSVCLCVCVCACVRACVCACVRACVSGQYFGILFLGY